jgi:hypothetical protein
MVLTGVDSVQHRDGFDHGPRRGGRCRAGHLEVGFQQELKSKRDFNTALKIQQQGP